MEKKSAIAIITGSVLAAAAGIFFFLKSRSKEKPPRRAPQVPVSNPGEQSDFPPAPTGERDLG